MSLDIPEPQVLVRFPNDDIEWHHRVLLAQLDAGAWIVGTPDFEVQTCDLARKTIRALARNSPFPVGLNTYAFDSPINVADLAAMRSEARRLQEVLGGPEVRVGAAAASRSGPGTDAAWRFADTAYRRFGEEVPQDLQGNPAKTTFAGSAGLVQVSDDGADEWTYMQKVKDDDLEEWYDAKRTGAGRDRRLMVCERDADGARRTLLTTALPLMRRDAEKNQKGWPFQGPSVAPDFLVGVQSTGHELLAYGDRYISQSGVNPKAGVAIEFVTLMTTLHFLITIDQVNVLNLAGAEMLMRRARMIQKAIRKNARAPDFEGLELHLTHLLDSTGGITTSAFDRHVAEEMRTEAITMKQHRLWREEHDADTKRKKDTAGHDKPGGKPPKNKPADQAAGAV
jgi:hypothetical protein